MLVEPPLDVVGQKNGDSGRQVQRLKKFSQERKLTLDMMTAIMSEEKKLEQGKLTLTGAKLRKFFPKSYTPQQMEQTIFKLLEQWQRKRQQDIER